MQGSGMGEGGGGAPRRRVAPSPCVCHAPNLGAVTSDGSTTPSSGGPRCVGRQRSSGRPGT
eukprot:3664078-Prymnesium_polylepis.1